MDTFDGEKVRECRSTTQAQADDDNNLVSEPWAPLMSLAKNVTVSFGEVVTTLPK